MNQDDNVVDFAAERGKRIHEVHDKRVDEMRKAFEQALPLSKPKKKKSKKKPR